MMKKNRFSAIIGFLFHFQNYAATALLKRMQFYNGALPMKFKKIVRKKGLNFFNSHPSQKNVINYITSRNMRKTLTPSSLNEASDEHNKIYILNSKEILNFIPISWRTLKKLLSLPASSSNFKFHTNSGLLGNLISKKPEGRPEEHEDSWAGPEAFKLITHIKDDFDEVVKKDKSVLVFFHAHWCPHCLRLKVPYGKTALMAKEANLEVTFAAFDVTINPDVADEQGVVGIPTIKLYRRGQYYATYKGKRTSEDLFEFVKNPPRKPSKNDNKKPDI